MDLEIPKFNGIPDIISEYPWGKTSSNGPFMDVFILINVGWGHEIESHALLS